MFPQAFLGHYRTLARSRRSTTHSRSRRRRPTAPVRPQAVSVRERPGSGWLWLAPPPRAVHTSAWALLPLRAFLGFTFCFAGLQKLANPAFFRASDPASIQAQLAGAAHRSPIHGLLGPLVHVAVPLGLLIALGELAVGLGTLLGLYARAAALGGTAISLGLFLTVSFHSHPYYTGSDIVFLFAWSPLVVAGAGALSLDALLVNLARRSRGLEAEAVVPIPFSEVRLVCGAYTDGVCSARRGAPCEPGPCPYLAREPALPRSEGAELDRRSFVLRSSGAGALAVLGVLGAGLAAGIGRLLGGAGSTPSSSSLSVGTSSSSTTSPPTSGPVPGPGPSTTTAPPHPPGVKLGPASAVPVGGAASFQDPATGDPSVVVQPQRGTFLAFDAVCPHAGCPVQYSRSDATFVCPCHGSVFNGRTGAVEVGPAQSGLTRISISEGSDGQLYAQ